MPEVNLSDLRPQLTKILKAVKETKESFVIVERGERIARIDPYVNYDALITQPLSVASGAQTTTLHNIKARDAAVNDILGKVNRKTK